MSQKLVWALLVCTPLWAGSSHAAGLLTLPAIEAAAKKAAAQAEAVKARALAEVEKAKQLAAEHAQAIAANAVAAANSVGAKVGENKTVDLASTKEKVIEKVGCRARSSKTSQEISGVFRDMASELTLQLSSITSGEKDTQDLAVKLVTEDEKEGLVVKFQLLDGTALEEDAVREWNLSDLGIQIQCEKRKRLEHVNADLASVSDSLKNKVLPDEAVEQLRVVKANAAVVAR